MKKILGFILCFTLVVTSPMIISATTPKELKDMKDIKPYYIVMEEFNKEHGTQFKLPSDKELKEVNLDKIEIYNNLKNLSIEQFKEQLNQEYNEIKDILNDNEINISIDNNKVDEEDMDGEKINIKEQGSQSSPDQIPTPSGEINTKLLKSMKEEVTQDVALDYGKVFLEAEITTGLGNNPPFYSRIINIGYYKFTDRTHFRASKYSYSLNTPKTECKVVYEGTLYSASGYILTTIKKYTITYTP